MPLIIETPLTIGQGVVMNTENGACDACGRKPIDATARVGISRPRFGVQWRVVFVPRHSVQALRRTSTPLLYFPKFSFRQHFGTQIPSSTGTFLDRKSVC